MFSDSLFLETCQEIENPFIDEYEFFTESMGVRIYRKYREVTGLYEYKVYGGLPGIKPEVCAQVYMDLEYRKVWDGYVKELREVEEGEKKGIYWQVNFPFPMSNRDYVYMRELKEVDYHSNRYWVILGKAVPFSGEPERPGVIRIDEFEKCMSLRSDGQNGTLAFMHYYDNPKGMIPTWLINWAASTGVPKFLSDMEKACKGYEKYKSSNQ